MREEELRRTDPLGPLDWLRLLPHVTAASSDRLGWVGLEAARYQPGAQPFDSQALSPGGSTAGGS